jgi:hypothetical protein
MRRRRFIKHLKLRRTMNYWKAGVAPLLKFAAVFLRRRD